MKISQDSGIYSLLSIVWEKESEASDLSDRMVSFCDNFNRRNFIQWKARRKSFCDRVNEPRRTPRLIRAPLLFLLFFLLDVHVLLTTENGAKPSTGRFQTVNYTTTSVIQPLGFVTTHDRDPFFSQSNSRGAKARRNESGTWTKAHTFVRF